MTKSFFKSKRRILYATLSIMLYFFVLAEIDRVTESVKSGLFFGGCVVVPTLFPFMILSDLALSAVTSCQGDIKRRSLFSRITHLPTVGRIALFLGVLSGFPIGAKITAALYEKGVLDRNEATRLLVLSNHTGPAFLFGAVAGLFSNPNIPLLLVLCELLPTVIYAFWSGKEAVFDPIKEAASSPTFCFSLIDSVEKAVFSVLKILGLIVTFRIIIDLSAVFFRSKLLLSILSAFCEIGNAASLTSELYRACPAMALTVLAFAVSFGGISVHMQSFLFFRKKKISACRYLLSKFILGILSAAFMSILLYFFPV